MSRLERLSPLIALIALVGAGAWYLTSLYFESGIEIALRQALEGSYNTFFLGAIMVMGGVFCSLADDDPPDFYGLTAACLFVSPLAVLLLMGLYYHAGWTIPGLGVTAVLIGILCSCIDKGESRIVSSSRSRDDDDYSGSFGAYGDSGYGGYDSSYHGCGGDYYASDYHRDPEPPIETYTHQEGGCGYGRHHRD